ncbi:tensin-1-like isoform X2 [Ruditapes philippinarum]|uniref:tensin-1-like isoform X2 n=1 Tax=Ruditapes philippinarum TaxID=129788 RepID=UPI00295A58AE|nr:tensin-1-like isoform X2 [Ruditapes philippinarum]
MYLGRAKKAIDQLDQKEFQEKEAKHAERESSKSESIEMTEEFAPEELPDGACFRLKSVNVGTDDGATAARQAEYIGSFSVSGEDQTTRTEFVQRQLESMHTVEKSKKVLLVLSLTGVKVCSSNGESVYMAHALKRISYAACDPEHRQFAFLAREPKGHINIQFCHAFITKTPEEAEELNTIIGNAFKMAYAQQKTRQPTFNELIEKQLVEQKAKFAEYQEQANRALQQRLNEIATPTALQRMEMRRQSSSDDLLESNCSTPTASEKDAKNKIWAKQALEKATHRSQASDSPVRSNSPTFSSSRPSNQQQQQGSRKSDPNFSATKRNSTPVQLSPSKSSNFNANSPKRNSSPHLANLQNFQVVTIRESLENNVNNSNRFKGSPVTALKDEIDRRYLSNGGGGTLDSGLGWGIGDDMDSIQRLKMNHHYDNEDQLQAPPTPPSKMQNRPLPAIPASSDFNDHRASPKLRNWTSLDDDVIPNHTRSTMQSRLRDSPKRRPQRPQSEVILDSKLSVFSGGGVDQPGVYIYGFKSQTQNELSKNCNVLNSNQLSNVNISPQFNNRSMQNPQSRETNTTQQKYSPKVNNSNHQYSPKGSNFTQTGYDNMNSLQNGKSSPPMHYQNGSPSHNAVVDHGEESSSTKKEKGGGLESLMGLDRSHIEDETLRHSCWYQAGIPRDVALEILQQEDIGSFIVRDSSTHPGCYALSVRVPKFENPTGISHYLILKTARGVKLKGLDKEWSSLFSLVTHHTVMPEMLPCTLRLPRDTNNPSFKPSDKDEKEEDPDYQRLADFSSMMEALKQ